MSKSKKSRALHEVLQELEVDAVTIEPLALQEEFVRLPGDIAYFGALFAEAHRKFLLAKHAQEKRAAELVLSKREELVASGVGRPTEAQVKASVEASAEWEDARLATIGAEVDREHAKVVFAALMAKKDALVSIGAQVRAEMGAQAPSVRDTPSRPWRTPMDTDDED